MLVFDVETDGLLPAVSKVHCIVIHDTDTGESVSYNDQANGKPPVVEALARIAAADEICGHNIVGYDIPVLQKLYPGFDPTGRLVDTIILAGLAYPDIKEYDFAAEKRHRIWIPKNLYGRQSLEAWGHRLGEQKGDFKGPWDSWTPAMEMYCAQDVLVTLKLAQKLLLLNLSEESLRLEHDVARIIVRQKARGFALDEVKAHALHKSLVKRQLEVESKLKDVFGHFYLRGPEFVPKRDNKTAGYLAGVPLCKVKLTEFNPGSRDHIANRLTQRYGWKPKKFTNEGKPQVDETVLDGLPYAPCRLLNEYLLIDKRLGMLVEGKEAILKAVKNGRVHGDVRTNAAVTGRMTHSRPNVAQTPRVGSPYGAEFRELYRAGDGYQLVGCDAAGLELRCLAHYMARYDGGAYGKAVVEGTKEAGTDVHSVSKQALGFNSRDTAKTFIYALLYGAGDEKLGMTVLDDLGAAVRQKVKGRKAVIGLGREARARLAKNLPALSRLLTDVSATVKKRGYLIGLDGRHLRIRSAHAALNTLLQSAGALVMKKALVLADAELRSKLKTGLDYEYVANVHDEIQCEARPEHAEFVGKTMADAIRLAGEHFKFRCPLAGEYKIGATWMHTH